MNHYLIPVVKGPTLREGVQTVIGAITAKVLIERYNVPERHTLQNKGYQRLPSESRVSNLATSIIRRSVDLPTALLVSLRDVAADDVLVKGNKGDFLLDLQNDGKSEDLNLYIVDGQHRVKALEKVLKEQQHDIQNMKIPFVCMIGADEGQEMEQFHVVNSNAKSVSTDLALDLLRMRAESNEEVMRELVQKGAKWKIQAQSIVEKLSTRNSSVWQGRIRLPNTPKGVTTITSSAMIRSLQDLLKHSPTFGAIKDEEKQIQIIDAYWSGIKVAFEGTKVFEDALDYSIQKGVGVNGLNGVLPIVIEVVRSNGKSIFAPVSYTNVMKEPLEKLEGEDSEGGIVKGADFWKSGGSGAAGIYSSRQGNVVLKEKIKSLIEDIRVE